MAMTLSSPYLGYAWTLPREPSDLRAQGLAYLRAKDYPRALNVLTKAAALESDNLQTRLCLGIALQAARRHEEALTSFQQIPEGTAEKTPAFTHAAYSELALGRVEAAIRAARQACALSPGVWQAHAALGQAELALGRAKRAENAFLAAIEIAPNSAGLWTQLAAARHRGSDPSGAETALRRALAYDPGHAGARAALAAFAAETTPSGLPPAEAKEGAAPPDIHGPSVWNPSDPHAALGLAVDYLSKKPVFERLSFGEWTRTLAHQIRRGHQCFIVDEERTIVGFLGWALTEQSLAQAWVEGLRGLRDDECRQGDCVIINAVAADTRAVEQLLLKTGRKLFSAQRWVYYKRFYRDGRSRPMRLALHAIERAPGRRNADLSAAPVD